MNDLIPKHSIEELCAHRDRALEMYRQAAECMAAAHRAAERALDGTRFYGMGDHDFRPMTYNPNPAEFAENARCNLDRQLWRHLMRLSRLSDVLDAQAREDLEKSLKDKPPAADQDTIAATLTSLVGSAAHIVKRGVVNLFRDLHPRFKRHDAFRIKARIALDYARTQIGGSSWATSFSWQSWNTYGRSRDQLIDLERLLHVLDGRKPPEHGEAVDVRIDAASKQEQDRLETEYLSLRWFKNGNVHATIKREDLVERINAILAEGGGIAHDKAA